MVKLVATQEIKVENNASREFEAISKSLQRVESGMKSVEQQADKTKKASGSFTSMMSTGIKQVASLALPYVGFKAFFGYLIDRSKYLVSTQNILHATNAEMEQFAKNAVNVSRASIFGTGEIFETAFEVSKRLGDVKLVNEALAPIAMAATATKKSISEVGIAVADMYNVFQGKETLADIANETGYALDKTKVQVSDLNAFIQNSTRTIRANGIGLKQTMAVFAELSKVGYGGARGGTFFNQLNRELGNVKKRGRLAGILGIKPEELDVQKKGFVNVIDTVAGKLNKLSDSNKQIALQRVFSGDITNGVIAMTQIIPLIKTYQDSLEKNGFTQKGNNLVLQSTYGAWERLRNNIMSSGEAFASWDGALSTVLNAANALYSVLLAIVGLIPKLPMALGLSESEKMGAINTRTVGLRQDFGVEFTDEEIQNNAKEEKQRLIDSIKNRQQRDKIFSDEEVKNRTTKFDFFNMESFKKMGQQNVNVKVEIDSKDKNLKVNVLDAKSDSGNKVNIKTQNKSLDF